MKIKIKQPNTLPNAWKENGLDKKAWDDLNSGKSVEVDSFPSGIELLVEQVGGSAPSTSKKPEARKQGDK